jgi:hypothetical protein
MSCEVYTLAGSKMGATLSSLAGPFALLGLAGLAAAAGADLGSQAGGVFFRADGSFNTLALAGTIVAGLLLLSFVRPFGAFHPEPRLRSAIGHPPFSSLIAKSIAISRFRNSERRRTLLPWFPTRSLTSEIFSNSPILSIQ